jgi:hypothetical protein
MRAIGDVSMMNDCELVMQNLTPLLINAKISASFVGQ